MLLDLDSIRMNSIVLANTETSQAKRVTYHQGE